MTSRFYPNLRSSTAVLLVLAGCSLIAARQPAFGQKASNDKNGEALHIEVQDRQGLRIAASEAGAKPQADSLSLAFQRGYQPGDRILVTGPRRMAVRMDENMPECLIYLSQSLPGSFVYDIPFGRAEQETGSAYAPESFSGDSHRVSVRAWSEQERHGYRNLALNPCDQSRTDPKSVWGFPHATSNSVARNLFDFEARNAIDGFTCNGHHGVWPYQSWGPQWGMDAWWKVDFGRPVTLDKIRLMIRTDFPHDSYWKRADVEFSDGGRITISIEPTARFQEFSIPARQTSWLRLSNLVPSDPSKWCSLVELEAWGRE